MGSYRAGEHRAGSASVVWPPPPGPARIEYVRAIYGAGDVGPPKSFFRRVVHVIIGHMPVSLRRPYGVASDSEGRVIVADRGTRSVQVYDFEARKTLEITGFGRQPFSTPIGVALGDQGSIYVTDSVLKKVGFFDREGRFLFEMGKDWAFARPTGIAYDSVARRVFVVDTLNNAVVILTAEGKYVKHFGIRGREEGQLYFPTNIFAGRDGLLYVSDSINFRVQVFRTDGSFVRSFGKLGDGSGDLARPRGVAVDSEGHIYVVDGWFDVVQIFNQSGEYLLGFGEPGSGPGQFWLPSGIWIDATDTIYVADSYNHRIQVFRYVGGSQP